MSKLKAIEVCNFMSIAEARLEFDESNIISICGYNDSGKSALTRLLEIMFYNAYSQDQAAFIKDGADYWGCSLEFDDGVEYNRYKYADGKSEYELKKDGKVLFTNKTAQGTILAMDKVPEAIENYLGVISVRDESMNEKLNVRRNTDKLFLINTTGGENYKMLNTILRSDLLAGASKRLSQDRNSLQSEVAVKSTEKSTISSELNSLAVCTEDALIELEQKVKKLEDSSRRSDYLSAIMTTAQEISNIVIPAEVQPIDTRRIADITALKDVYEQTQVSIPAECTIIDVSRLRELANLLALKDSISVAVAPECTVVDTTHFEDIKQICGMYNDLYNMYQNLAVVEDELNKTKTTLSDLAKVHGFKICQNCGTVVE